MILLNFKKLVNQNKNFVFISKYLSIKDLKILVEKQIKKLFNWLKCKYQLKYFVSKKKKKKSTDDVV